MKEEERKLEEGEEMGIGGGRNGERRDRKREEGVGNGKRGRKLDSHFLLTDSPDGR